MVRRVDTETPATMVISLSIRRLEAQHFLEIVQGVQHLLDRQGCCRATSPIRPVLCADDEIVVTDQRRIMAGEQQRQLLLDLILVGDQEVAGGAVATGLID